MVHEEHRESLRELIVELLRDDHAHDAVALLTNRHPADQADFIEQLDEEDRERVLRSFSPDQLSEVLEYLSDDLRSSLLEDVPVDTLVPLLDRLDEDVAADILQGLEEEKAEEVVKRLEAREYVEELLDYPEESAGGRMSIDFVALRRAWTVDESIQFLRRESPDDTHPFYLYVVDEEQRLTGTVSLRSLVTAAPETPIAAILREELITAEVHDDQEQVAERMRHYNLLALPVVDAEYKLRGVITADDVLDVQVEEATEDIFRMAGLAEEERIFRPIRQALPPRLAWLILNLFTALMAAVTISAFEGTVERVAALAIFMPVVAGMGGNAGIQTITLVVRSIALGEVEGRDAMRILRHEIAIALVKGVVVAFIAATIAWVWQDSPWLGLIVGLALLANIANATLVGVLVPLVLKHMRADPALASGVIVTTFSDVVGFFVFLGLGTLLISKLD
jgi:magnesium transporter